MHAIYLEEANALLDELRALDRNSATTHGAPVGLRAEIETPMRRALAQHTAMQSGAVDVRADTITSLLEDVRTVRAKIEAAVAAHAYAIASHLVDQHRDVLVEAAAKAARTIAVEDLVVTLLDRCSPELRREAWEGPPVVFTHHREAAAAMIAKLSKPVAAVLESPAPRGTCFCVVFTYGRAVAHALEIVPSPKGEA